LSHFLVTDGCLGQVVDIVAVGHEVGGLADGGGDLVAMAGEVDEDGGGVVGLLRQLVQTIEDVLAGVLGADVRVYLGGGVGAAAWVLQDVGQALGIVDGLGKGGKPTRVRRA
jgi:hypothetical protein